MALNQPIESTEFVRWRNDLYAQAAHEAAKFRLEPMEDSLELEPCVPLVKPSEDGQEELD